MSLSIYDLNNNFMRVSPKFVDTRLISHFCHSTNWSINNVANTITHLLIYKKHIESASENSLIIYDGLSSKIFMENNIVYISNINNLSYIITNTDVQKILDLQPLKLPIHYILTEILAYNIKTMGFQANTDNIWHEIFNK